ncbi:hypothetical protein ACRE51_27100, partial [Klebsiella pneumoniae]|nr:hypothetical protein [Klebsiella pneumoniae]MEA4783652.1 hypothetical protein [Klebsiella pneumoniae]
KRAYCLKTQPATGETYPKSDLFNKAAQQLQNALQRVSDLIEAAHQSLSQEVDYFGNWRSEENREIIASALNISTDSDVSR